MEGAMVQHRLVHASCFPSRPCHDIAQLDLAARYKDINWHEKKEGTMGSSTGRTCTEHHTQVSVDSIKVHDHLRMASMHGFVPPNSLHLSLFCL